MGSFDGLCGSALLPAAEQSVYKDPSHDVQCVSYHSLLFLKNSKTHFHINDGAFLLRFFTQRRYRKRYGLSGTSEGNTCYLNSCRLELLSKYYDTTKCLAGGPCSSWAHSNPFYAVSPVARNARYIERDDSITWEHTNESAPWQN